MRMAIFSASSRTSAGVQALAGADEVERAERRGRACRFTTISLQRAGLAAHGDVDPRPGTRSPLAASPASGTGVTFTTFAFAPLALFAIDAANDVPTQRASPGLDRIVNAWAAWCAALEDVRVRGRLGAAPAVERT